MTQVLFSLAKFTFLDFVDVLMRIKGIGVSRKIIFKLFLRFESKELDWTWNLSIQAFKGGPEH